jgi:hypothetical protein
LKLQEYSGSFNKISSGTYSIYIQLFDEKSGRPVEIGLKESLKNDDGFFRIAEIEI